MDLFNYKAPVYNSTSGGISNDIAGLQIHNQNQQQHYNYSLSWDRTMNRTYEGANANDSLIIVAPTTSSTASESDVIYLEAIQKPYRTMVEAVFILTAIVAFLFNCIALWLILCKKNRRSFRSPNSGRCRALSATLRGHPGGNNASVKSPKESIAQIKSNGKICEVLHSDSGLGMVQNVGATNGQHYQKSDNLASPSLVSHLGTQQQKFNYITPQRSFSGQLNSQSYCSQPPPQKVTRVRSSPSSSSQLNIYLVNLFINDLIIASFNVPFTYVDFMYGQWIYWSWLCPATNFISICAVSVSIYTLIAIGFERYFAIICPFKKLGPFERHTKYIILLIWMIGVILASPMLVQSRAMPFQYRNETLSDCRELWENQVGSKVYTGILFVATFLLPFLLLSFLYISIAVKAFRHVIPGNADASRDQIQLRNKVKIIKMLVLLVIMFAVCWLPLQTFNMVVWLCDRCRLVFSDPSVYNFYVSLTFICQWFSIAHAMLDPIIYCFSSRNFNLREFLSEIRRQWKRIFCCQKETIPPLVIGTPASNTPQNTDSIRRTSASSSIQHRNSSVSKVSGRASLDSAFSAAQRSSHSSIQRFSFEPVFIAPSPKPTESSFQTQPPLQFPSTTTTNLPLTASNSNHHQRHRLHSHSHPPSNQQQKHHHFRVCETRSDSGQRHNNIASDVDSQPTPDDNNEPTSTVALQHHLSHQRHCSFSGDQRPLNTVPFGNESGTT